MVTQIALCVLSLMVLFAGAEISLKGGEKLGRIFGLSPLFIGLFLIGMGTSLPEFFVSQISAYRGVPEMALGNIFGSNLANFYLILGMAFLFSPMKIHRSNLVFHFLILNLFHNLFLIGMILFGKLNLGIVIGLTALFGVYLLVATKDLKKEEKVEEEGREKKNLKNMTLSLFFLILGLVFLYYGGELLISSGQEICRIMGVSEFIISVIFLAFGTSFPELMTCAVAIYRKKDTDLILGNILGSNIFNGALILASLYPYNIKFSQKLIPEVNSLLFGSFVLLSVSFLKGRVGRLLGVFFLGVYTTLIIYWLT